MRIPTVAEVMNHYGMCAWILDNGEDWRELLRLATRGQELEAWEAEQQEAKP